MPEMTNEEFDDLQRRARPSDWRPILRGLPRGVPAFIAEKPNQQQALTLKKTLRSVALHEAKRLEAEGRVGADEWRHVAVVIRKVSIERFEVWARRRAAAPRPTPTPAPQVSRSR
ncbi:MAG: hypothetical protein WC273_00465 [Dehalococcoidia bacterium]